MAHLTGRLWLMYKWQKYTLQVQIGIAVLTWTPSKGARVLFHRQGGSLPPSFPHLHLLTMSRCLQNLTQLFSTLYEASRCSVVSNSLTPMDYNLPGLSVHGIFQARILEWVAISSFRGSSSPGMEPMSPVSPALQVDSLCWVTGEAQVISETFSKHLTFTFFRKQGLWKSSYHSCVFTPSCFIVMEKQWGLGNRGSK